MSDDSYQQVKDYSLKLLSFRPRSVKEMQTRVKQFCVKKNLPSHFVDKLISELINQKLLDDKEFVSWWIEQREAFHPKSLRALEIELLGKGVEKKIIESVFQEKGKGKQSEYEQAFELIRKKSRVLEKVPWEKRKIKIRNFLLHRGFTYEIIYKVIDSLEKELLK